VSAVIDQVRILQRAIEHAQSEAIRYRLERDDHARRLEKAIAERDRALAHAADHEARALACQRELARLRQENDAARAALTGASSSVSRRAP
jgi:peptidoglycan hydrolase CwlO-like protein